MAANHYQVTGYGEEGLGDDNDVWRIEIEGGKAGDIVNTMTSGTLSLSLYSSINCNLQ